MKMRYMLLPVMVIASMLAAACSPGENTKEAMMDPTPTGSMMEETLTPDMMDKPTTTSGTDEMMEETSMPGAMDAAPTEEMMDGEPTDAMMDETPSAMTGTGIPETGAMDDQEAMMAPAWYSTQLTNEVTGEPFKIEDFKGKVVLLQTFAQWCPTCLNQQQEIAKLHEMMGMRDDLVSVSLDVDPNEDAAMLKKYLEKHGFDWHYAIAPAETIREIGSLYGESFLNPPSAPMLIIDRKGEAHSLPFGIKSADDLQEALEPFLEMGM